MHHYKNLTYDCFMILSSSCSFFSDIAFATLSINLLNSCFTVSPSSSILHLMLAIFENTGAETNAKAQGNLGNMRNFIACFQTGRSVVTWISVFKTPLKRLWNELWSSLNVMTGHFLSWPWKITERGFLSKKKLMVHIFETFCKTAGTNIHKKNFREAEALT